MMTDVTIRANVDGPAPARFVHMPRIALGVLLGAVLLLLALPTGRFVWNILLVALLLAATAAGLCARLAQSTERHTQVDGGATPLIVTYALLLAFFVLSLLPLPLPLSRLSGGARAEHNRRAGRALVEARDAGVVSRVPLPLYASTRNRAGSVRFVMLVIASFSALILASLLAPPQRRTLLRCLAGAGALVGVAGYVSSYWNPQGDTLWWVYSVPHALPGPVACFRNRNHYAGFLAILAPPALALLMEDLRQRRFALVILSLLSCTALSLGVVLSLSRGGLLSLIGGLFAAAFLMMLRKRIAQGVAMLLLGALVVTCILSLPSEALRQRWESLEERQNEDSYVTRVHAWADSLRIWRHYPVLGAGPNAFRAVYPQHRTTSRSFFLTHAENEYVQLLADGGLVGAALFVALLASLAVALLEPTSPSHEVDALLPAAGGALGAAMVAAFVDFPQHIPLYAVCLAAVVGCAVPPPSFPRPWDRWGTASVCAAAVLVLLFLCAPDVRRLRQDDPVWMSDASADSLALALRAAPTSSYAWYYLGRKGWTPGNPRAMAFAETCMDSAVHYDPQNYKLWKELGLLRLNRGDRDGARLAFRRVKELRSWVAVPTVPRGPQ